MLNNSMKTLLENGQKCKAEAYIKCLNMFLSPVLSIQYWQHLRAGRGGVLLPPRQAAGQAGGEPRLRAGGQARLLQGDPQLNSANIIINRQL